MKTRRNPEMGGQEAAQESVGGQQGEEKKGLFERSNEWIRDMLGLGNDVEADPGITEQDLIYEQMAHRMVYQSDLHPEDKELLTAWGYKPEWQFLNGEKGLQAARFDPAEGSGRKAVLVFRGTEPTEIADLKADLTSVIGQEQFDANREAIHELMGEEGSYDVTGHSLGASIAQLAAMDDPKRVDNLVGFQAPGVSHEQAAEFSQMEDRPEARYHLAKQDMVDLGGEAHLEGEFFVHNARNLNNVLDAHTGYLLLSPQYDEMRAELGLTDEMLGQLDERNEGTFGLTHNTDKLTEQHESDHYDAYPREKAKTLVEHLRQGIGEKVEWAEDAHQEVHEHFHPGQDRRTE